MTRAECIALLYRYAEYDGMGLPNLAGCKEAMKMAADLLSQHSIPSGLDEAAEEYGYINWQSEDYHEGASEGLPFDAIGHTANCFKAGAEWMAGQGETIEGEVVKDIKNNLVVIAKGFSGKNAVFGDKVTVQIRKK